MLTDHDMNVQIQILILLGNPQPVYHGDQSSDHCSSSAFSSDSLCVLCSWTQLSKDTCPSMIHSALVNSQNTQIHVAWNILESTVVPKLFQAGPPWLPGGFLEPPPPPPPSYFLILNITRLKLTCSAYKPELSFGTCSCLLIVLSDLAGWRVVTNASLYALCTGVKQMFGLFDSDSTTHQFLYLSVYDIYKLHTCSFTLVFMTYINCIPVPFLSVYDIYKLHTCSFTLVFMTYINCIPVPLPQCL